MKTINKLLIGGVVSLISIGSFAENSGFTLGGKIGQLDINGADDGDTIGLNLGYAFGNGFSAEFELTRGDTDIIGIDVDVDTTAIYGTYRSAGTVYFLGKLGYLEEEVSGGGVCLDDSGASYGIGGGYRFSDSFSLELEYTIVEEDVNLIGFTARVIF